MDFVPEFVFRYDKEVEQFEDIIYNKDIEHLFEVNKDKPLAYSISRNSSSNNRTNTTTRKNNEKHKDVCLKNRKKIKRCANLNLSNVVSENENFIKSYMKESLSNKKVIYDLKQFSQTSELRNRFTQRALAKLNVNQNRYSEQYIKYNNKTVLLAGGKGGRNKFIDFSYAFKSTRKSINKSPKEKLPNNLLPHYNTLTAQPRRIRGLLSSLNISFKPGPLKKKPQLSESINTELGKIEFIQMPSIGLSIVPQVGVSINSNVSRLLKYVRDERGFIDNKWADFATSTVQKADEKVINTDEHIFLIPYEKNRSKILMRRDPDVLRNRQNQFNSNNDNNQLMGYDLYENLEYLDSYRGKDDIENSVRCILSDVLRSVAIGEVQNCFSVIDPDNPYYEQSEQFVEKKSVNGVNKKIRKKKSNEMAKLDIKVIEMDLDSNKNIQECNNEYCKLGCVCSSLNNKYLLNEHCGLAECMLNCVCNLNERKNNENQQSEISSSAVINLQYQLNKNLSKEEAKFQRTIIRSKDQTIVLGACRREVKLPKRYEEYLTSSPDELYEVTKKKALETTPKVILYKLPSEVSNCDCWCMTHQLYKCFCKGKFTTGINFSLSESFDNDTFSSTLGSILPIESEGDDNDFCSRTSYIPNLFKNRKQKSQQASRDFKANDITCNSSSTQLKNNSRRDVLFKKKEEMKSEILDNSFLKKKMKDFELVYNISESIQNNYIVMPWVAMMGQYILDKIHIWITCEEPYEEFITVVNSIDHKYKCINIKEATKDLLQKYPPFITEIFNKMDSHGSYIFLMNIIYAWKIIFCFRKKKNLTNIKLNQTNTIPSSSSSDHEMCTPTNELTNSVLEKSDNVKEKSDNDEKYNTTSKNNNIVENLIKADDSISTRIIPINNISREKELGRNKWFMIDVRDDFEEIDFFTKRLVIPYEHIVHLFKAAYKSNKLTRKLSEDRKFGIYISPHFEQRRMFCGPYDSNESGMVNIKRKKLKYDVRTTCGFWLDPKEHADMIQLLNDTSQNYLFEDMKLQNYAQQNFDNEKIVSPGKFVCLNPNNLNDDNSFFNISCAQNGKSVSTQIGSQITDNASNDICKVACVKSIISNQSRLDGNKKCNEKNNKDNDVIVTDNVIYEISDSE